MKVCESTGSQDAQLTMSEAYHAELRVGLEAYVKLRQSMQPPVAKVEEPAVVEAGDIKDSSSSVQASMPPSEDEHTPRMDDDQPPTAPLSLPPTLPHLGPFKPPLAGILASYTPGTPSSAPIAEHRTHPPTTSTELLSHIAWLSEAALHAADERLNAADSALAASDRALALVEQALKDAATQLALRTRPGTRPGAVVLPEIVAPSTRALKAAAAAQAPVAALAHAQGPLELLAAVAEGASARTAAASGALKIVLPAAAAVDDPTPYCYCNQPSYGEVNCFVLESTVGSLSRDTDDCLRQRTVLARMGKNSYAGQTKQAERVSPVPLRMC
jgi:hypothetical protein